MKQMMYCICCGSENTDIERENSASVKANEFDFGLTIPHVEIWICNECGMGWKFQDGVLVGLGLAWHSIENVKIPDGALAVLREE